jgi:hypothetical protein
MVELGLLTLVCLALATWRLRPAQQRKQQAAPHLKGRWWDRPPIGDAPMRWKERFVGDWLSLPIWRALPRWLKCALWAGLIACIALAWPERETFIALGAGQFVFSGLFVAIRSAGAITGERANQTWDSLLTTQMDAYQIVRGKLWGQIDAIRPYLLAYLGPALLGAMLTGPWEIAWIVCTWLASWVYLYHLGAAGISYSIKATSTWRSILTTLTVGNYSFVSTLALTGILFGLVGLVIHSVVLRGVWPGTAALVFVVLAPGPGLLWIFVGTEQVLQEAEQELRRRYPPMV